MQHKEESPTFIFIMIGFELAITAQERVLEVSGSKEIQGFIIDGSIEVSTQSERKEIDAGMYWERKRGQN